MNLPIPERIETIIQTEMPTRGDGEWLYALQYSEILGDLSELGFKQVMATNQNEVERLINKFKDDTINTHLGNNNKQREVIEAFQQLNTTVSQKDYYRYFAKNGGGDYYITLYQPEHSRLFMFEWHQ